MESSNVGSGASTTPVSSGKATGKGTTMHKTGCTGTTCSC